MRTLESASLDVSKLSPMQQYWAYNALDCCITFEVFEKLAPKIPEAGFAYDMSRTMQAPAFTLMNRGVRLDKDKVLVQLADLRERRARCEEIFFRLTTEGLGLEPYFDAKHKKHFGINPNSPQQLQALFYEHLAIPAIKNFNRQTKEETITTNREALEKLQKIPKAKPFCDIILAIRDCDKQIQVLLASQGSGRMHCSYQVAGTLTGRWSSNESAFGGGCVPPETEVLTPDGWRRIDSIASGQDIMQYNVETKELSFVSCGMYSTPFAGQLLEFSSEQSQFRLTPGHRVLHFGPNNNELRVDPAQVVAARAQTCIPIGGAAHGTWSVPPFLAMLLADFTFEGSGWRGAFKKARKIERFLLLANRFGFAYTEQKALSGYRRFYVPGFVELPRAWGAWVLNLEQECATALVEELRYWDAHDRGAGFIFFTAKKEAAGWVATLAHLANRGATIRREEQNVGSYSTTPMYWVNIKNRAHIRALKTHWKKIPYEGTVYCPQVPTSYWLMRYNGHISVTGNTNLQNISDEMRRIFIPDPGKKFAQFDLEQAESKLVAYLALPWGDNYLRACLSGDLHTTTTMLVWPALFPEGTNDPRKIAELPFYRHFSYRDMAKRGGHTSNYDGTPAVLSMHLKIPREAAEAFQHAYFKAFPEIRHWQNSVRLALAKDRSIVTPLGRRCFFPGRPWDNDTVKSAIAYDPQSSIGDILNLGFYNVWKNLDSFVRYDGKIELLTQVHDSILFQYNAEDEQWIIPKVAELLKIPVEIHGKECVVGTEGAVGWNWGKFHPKDNPHGLMKWKGSDSRVAPAPASFLDRKLHFPGK